MIVRVNITQLAGIIDMISERKFFSDGGETFGKGEDFLEWFLLDGSGELTEGISKAKEEDCHLRKEFISILKIKENFFAVVFKDKVGKGWGRDFCKESVEFYKVYETEKTIKVYSHMKGKEGGDESI